MRCFHKAYGNFGRGVLYRNFAGQGCYRETIYSLLCVANMKATAWNNGSHHKSGAGYGLKLAAPDRDRYFKRCWKSICIRLPNGLEVEVNTDKASFWNESCRELINKGIGIWLIESHKAPWPLGTPPTFQLLPQGERSFILQEDETEQ